MATNPMQKKARNAFLLGVLIMLIISAIAGAFVYFLVFANEDKEKEKEGIQTKQVYILTSTIPSGQKIKNGENVKLTEIETSISSGIASVAELNATYPNLDLIAKIDLPAGTILTTSMISVGEAVTNDIRRVEYNMVTLPTSINIGDYIDIRLTLPTGQDFIVISKKPIMTLQGETLGIDLSEGEILMMNSAIVEAYIMTASNIYATKYVEPGLQTAAVNTYRPSESVVELIRDDINIVAEAKIQLTQFYNSEASAILRQKYVNPAVQAYAEEALDNIEEGIVKQKEDAKKARQDYLTGISTTTTTTN